MKRILLAFFYSLQGLRAAWRDEMAFRQEVVIAAFMLPLAYALAPDRLSLALMAGSVLLVLLVELLNTAIEAAIDRHGGEIHPQSKKAKDTASAAVLLAILIAGFTWAAILL